LSKAKKFQQGKKEFAKPEKNKTFLYFSLQLVWFFKMA